MKLLKAKFGLFYFLGPGNPAKKLLSQSDQSIDLIDNHSHGNSKKILYNKIVKKYTTLCDLPRFKYMAVNPRHLIYFVVSYTVNIRHLTGRIYDFMRLVGVFRRETVVLQVSASNINRLGICKKNNIGENKKNSKNFNRELFLYLFMIIFK